MKAQAMTEHTEAGEFLKLADRIENAACIEIVDLDLIDRNLSQADKETIASALRLAASPLPVAWTDTVAEILRRTFGADDVQSNGCASRILAALSRSVEAGAEIIEIIHALRAYAAGEIAPPGLHKRAAYALEHQSLEIERLRAELETSRELCTKFEEAVGEDVETILQLRSQLGKAKRALRHLTNEIGGIWYAFEIGIRQEISNTNYAVVRDKITESESVLATLTDETSEAGK